MRLKPGPSANPDLISQSPCLGRQGQGLGWDRAGLTPQEQELLDRTRLDRPTLFLLQPDQPTVH